MTYEANPRVLMIGPSLSSRGGMATVERQLVERLPEAGVQTKFIPTYDDCGKLGKLAIALIAFLQFRFMLNKTDIVHIHMASRGSYTRKKMFIDAANRRGVPVVLHLHAAEFALWFDRECSEKERHDIRNTFIRCARVVVLSKEWKSYLIDKNVCDSGRIAVLNNAVDVPSKNRTDYSLNTVLFMGRLDNRKSPDAILRAAAKLLPLHPDAKFIFGGDGDIAAYENLARELGVINNCRFLGWVTAEKKIKAYRDSSIYCLPSKNEGMPMSVLEAMSYGLATISTPVGGVPQVISDGANGMLFPVDDIDALTKILDQLMSDTALKERIGKNGRVRIEEAFSLDAFLKQVKLIYGQVRG